MPFISQDWRGPGEDWVRGQDGWETTRVAGGRRRGKSETDLDKEIDKENWPVVPCQPARLERHRSLPELQPFCPIVVKSTKEVAGFNTLTDALKRLDFRSAVHDIRRFQYVSHLLRLLLTPEKLSHLPGGSQKLIFRILEEMASAVYTKNQNEHILRKLLGDLHTTLDQYRVWGAHLGSEQMLRGHNASRSRIACIAAVEKRRSMVRLEEEQREAEQRDSQLDNLPEECVREILLRLSDGGDVDRAGNTCPTMSFIVKEKRIWRELVQAHFTKSQVECVISKKPELAGNKRWRDLYICLKKKFGLRQEFTELVMLCKPCRVLFWASYGHPCLADNAVPHIPITPKTFLTFFSV